jgi:hypothetical protein
VDEDGGKEHAATEAHDPGHQVLHPFHAVLLQKPDLDFDF